MYNLSPACMQRNVQRSATNNVEIKEAPASLLGKKRWQLISVIKHRTNRAIVQQSNVVLASDAFSSKYV